MYACAFAKSVLIWMIVSFRVSVICCVLATSCGLVTLFGLIWSVDVNVSILHKPFKPLNCTEQLNKLKTNLLILPLLIIDKIIQLRPLVLSYIFPQKLYKTHFFPTFHPAQLSVLSLMIEILIGNPGFKFLIGVIKNELLIVITGCCCGKTQQWSRLGWIDAFGFEKHSLIMWQPKRFYNHLLWDWTISLQPVFVLPTVSPLPPIPLF